MWGGVKREALCVDLHDYKGFESPLYHNYRLRASWSAACGLFSYAHRDDPHARII